MRGRVAGNSTGDLRASFFPEIAAGGYTRLDGTVEFYGRVNALLEPAMTVLDFGAGRGEWLEDPVSYRRDLRRLRGKVARVVGADVDPVVRGNPGCDDAVVVGPGGALPLADGSVDLVVSDHTFEHVSEPGPVAAELGRVLRVGGWLCARTPNRWGYIGLGARLVPNASHGRVLRVLQPGRQEQDVFPVRYRLNTARALERYFPPERFAVHAYTVNAEPAYVGASRVAWHTLTALGRVVPERFGAKYMIFIQKVA